MNPYLIRSPLDLVFIVIVAFVGTYALSKAFKTFGPTKFLAIS